MPDRACPKVQTTRSGIVSGSAGAYLHPRNPCGRGYLVEATPEGFAGLLLPQLEDPGDPLTAARLADIREGRVDVGEGARREGGAVLEGAEEGFRVGIMCALERHTHL